MKTLNHRSWLVVGGLALIVVLALGSERIHAQAVHTEAYQLGLKIEDTIQKGDITLFAKVLDTEALLDRTLNPIRISDELRQEIRKNTQAHLSSKGVAESVVKSAKNLTFVGVRRLNGEYHLLYHCTDERNTLTYYSFILGKGPLGQATLLDVYLFAPGEFMSETARRGTLLSLAAAPLNERAKSQIIQGLEDKQRDLISSQDVWNTFLNRCASGHYALVLQAYAKLPPSLQTDKFVLFNRVLAALHEDESTFLEATAPWRKTYSTDPVLEMLVSDFYWERKQDRQAMVAFEKLNDLLGGDPELDLRIAKAHQGLGETKQAMACLWQGARRDPPSSAAFAALLKETISSKTFDETARALSLKEATYDKDLKPEVASDPAYAEFRKSAAFQAWLKSPRQQLNPVSSASIDSSSGDSLKLQAILFSPSRSSATINGKILFTGDQIGAYKIAQIEPQRVTLRSAAGETNLLTLKAK